MKEYTPKYIAYVLDEVLKAQKKEVNGPSAQELKTDWVKKTAMELVNTLEKEVKKYNEKNKPSYISKDDLLSAVTATLHLLMKNTGKLDTKQ